MSLRCRALRGAITVEENSAEEIIKATQEVLLLLVKENGLSIDDVVSIIFTMTRDLNATYPAVAARAIGWTQVPMLCFNELEISGSMPRCIRVLMHINTEKSQNDLKHIYLRDAIALRQDLVQ